MSDIKKGRRTRDNYKLVWSDRFKPHKERIKDQEIVFETWERLGFGSTLELSKELDISTSTAAKLIEARHKRLNKFRIYEDLGKFIE